MAFKCGAPRRVPSLMSLAYFHTNAKERDCLPSFVRDECAKRNLRDIDALVFVAYGPALRCYFDDCDDPVSCARKFLLRRLLREDEIRTDPEDLNIEET